MKTFKEYVSEGFSNAGMPVIQQQWQDQDAMPSAETAVEALNAFVGAIGDHEYMNPRIAFKKLEENLEGIVVFKNEVISSTNGYPNYYWDLLDSSSEEVINFDNVLSKIING